MEKTKPGIITLKQQEQMGLRPPAAQRFVPVPRTSDRVAPPVNGEIVYTIDAEPAAQQHVMVKTSEVDRSLGFLITSIPFCGIFGVAVTLVAIVGFGMPATTGLVITVLTLSAFAALLVIYSWSLQTSPGGVSLYEAKEKWGLISREHENRWAAFWTQHEIQQREKQ